MDDADHDTTRKPSPGFNPLLALAICCQVVGLLFWFHLTDVGLALLRLTRLVAIEASWLKNMAAIFVIVTGGVWLDYFIVRSMKRSQTVKLVVYLLALPVTLAIVWLVVMVQMGGTFVARG